MPFVINIDPVALHQGPLEIRWYGIAMAAIAWLLWLAHPRVAVLRSEVPR